MRAGTILSIAFVTLSAAAAARPAKELRVTFLGTGGGPAVPAGNAGPSALVEFGDEVLLIDAGRGLVERLQQIESSPARVARVFITHLHSDPTVGLPELWLSGWWRGRKSPLQVYGPRGTRVMTASLQKAWAYDVAIRTGPPKKNVGRQRE